MQKFKNYNWTDRDKFLLTVFVVCCVLLAWMVGDLIVYSRTISGIYCVAENKVWSARENTCYTEDAR